VTDVLVWTIRAILPHEELAALVTVLSDKERQKAMRFRRAADRNQYIVAHGRLREILSAELAIPASEVALSSNENGKPHAVLDQDESPIEFSLSHSGDVALVAVSRTGAVGVDIERIDSDTGVLAIAERCFSKQEWETLQSTSESERLTRFFQLWVCKEAYVKGRGEGIIDRLRSFTISLEARGPQLVQDDHDPDAAARWELQLLDAPDGFCAAIAICNPGPRPTTIHARDWNQDSESG